MNIVGQQLSWEIQRVAELKKVYEKLPQRTTKLAASIMAEDLSKAREALASGDIQLIIECIKDLESWES